MQIAAKSKEYAHKLSTPEIVQFLIGLFQRITNQIHGTHQQHLKIRQNTDALKGITIYTLNLRSSALSSLARLCHHKSSMAMQIVEMIGHQKCVLFLKDPTMKIRQCIITIINLCISNDAFSRVSRQLIENEQFSNNIMDLLEHEAAILRGKALTTLYLLCRSHNHIVFHCCHQFRLCNIVERMNTREKDKYVKKCLQALAIGLAGLISPILRHISTDLEENRLRASMAKQRTNAYLQVALLLVTTPSINQQLATSDTVSVLAKCLRREDPRVFTDKIMLVLEAFTSMNQQTVLLNQHQSVSNHLLPALLRLLQSDDGDLRFNSLKLFTDILVLYLNEPSIYGTENDERAPTSTVKKQVCICVHCLCYLM